MLRHVKAGLRSTPVGTGVRTARRHYRALPSRQRKALENLRADWQARGAPVPAPNELKIAEVVRYAEDFGARVFIETGTCYGDTLAAVQAHVARAWSIELAPELASRARIRFARDAHVDILEGDSGAWVPRLLADIYEPVLFWLDGHWSMGETAKGDLDTPIEAELTAILEHRVEDHIVLIDDARLFGTGDYPAIDDVRALVARHRPAWQFSVEADIIRAHAPRAAST